MADLVDRIAKMQDKENQEATQNHRTTRSKAAHDPLIEKKSKTIEKTQKALEHRLEDVESIVE